MELGGKTMKVLKVLLLILFLQICGPMPESSASIKQDLDFNKHMYQLIKEGNDGDNNYEIDNSQLSLDGASIKDYFRNNFRNYPHGIAMNIKNVSYLGSCYSDELKCNIYFKFNYFYDKADVSDFESQMKNFSSKLLNDTFNNKVNTIVDYVKATGDYGSNTTGSAHSPITFIREGYGVCQAYATMTQRLLDYAGIENYLLSGQANGGVHVWNVLFDGKGNMYHLDVTWEDGLNNGAYYLITTNQLDNLGTHQYLQEDLNTIVEAHSYFNSPSLPPTGDPKPGMDNPELGDIKEPDSSGHIPKALQDFIANKDKSKKVTDLGVQPSDKNFKINFSSKVGGNYGDRILMYNIDTAKTVELDFEKDGKSVIAKPEGGNMDKGEYYLIILSGVQSDDDPPLETKVDYYVTFKVE